MWGFIVIAAMTGYGVFLWAAWLLARAAATHSPQEDR